MSIVNRRHCSNNTTDQRPNFRFVTIVTSKEENVFSRGARRKKKLPTETDRVQRAYLQRIHIAGKTFFKLKKKSNFGFEKIS